MHPMAGLCVLHGLSLYQHTIYTSEYRIRFGTDDDRAMLMGHPTAYTTWAVTQFTGGMRDLTPVPWADVPNHVMDRLTPALIQQISST